MGAEIYLLPEKGEGLKVRRLLKIIDPDGKRVIESPSVEDMIHPADCWFQWRGKRLDIGYNFGNFLNGEWALAIAQEICKRFRIKRAGWDSTGYCDTLSEFTDCKPCSVLIQLREDAINNRNLKDSLKSVYRKEIQSLKNTRKVFERAANKLIENGIKEILDQ